MDQNLGIWSEIFVCLDESIDGRISKSYIDVIGQPLNQKQSNPKYQYMTGRGHNDGKKPKKQKTDAELRLQRPFWNDQ